MKCETCKKEIQLNDLIWFTVTGKKYHKKCFEMI